MPALSFFATERDLPVLIKRLNDDDEIAVIVPDAIDNRTAGRWKVVRTVLALRDGQHSLWHIPAGPLPLMQNTTGLGPLVRPPDPSIPDPWAGWVEKVDMRGERPRFGPGCHCEIRLTLSTRYSPYTNDELSTLPVVVSYWTHGREFLESSSFQWTGGHFRSAPPQTQRWWNRLKAWMDRAAVRLPTGSSGVTFWSFPFASELLKRGIPYGANNWPLDDAIRRATPITPSRRT
jgi:hypothetical protein